MGVHEGRGKLTKAMKELMFRWTETRSVWNDAMARQFEERYITPLQIDLKNAVSAMDHMSGLLQQIRHECR
jgi:hypothetical protein